MAAPDFNLGLAFRLRMKGEYASYIGGRLAFDRGTFVGRASVPAIRKPAGVYYTPTNSRSRFMERERASSLSFQLS
jgi:hypothetical protein